MNPYLSSGTQIAYAGKTYTVIKTNPKNFVVERDGTRYNLPRTARITLVEKERSTTPAPETSRPDFSKMVPGAVVRVKVPPSTSKFTYAPDQAFVVLKHNFDLVNIVKLGGEGGAGYWRLPLSSLEIVDVS